MRISDWSSDVCSSDLEDAFGDLQLQFAGGDSGLLQLLDHPVGQNRAAELGRGGVYRDMAEGQSFLPPCDHIGDHLFRSEEHTSGLQSLMRISYAVFCLQKKKINTSTENIHCTHHKHK